MPYLKIATVPYFDSLPCNGKAKRDLPVGVLAKLIAGNRRHSFAWLDELISSTPEGYVEAPDRFAVCYMGREVPGLGFGVFAMVDIPKGTPLFPYTGKIEPAVERPGDPDRYAVFIGENTLLTARECGNLAGLIQYAPESSPSCREVAVPGCGFSNLELKYLDYFPWYVATDDIKAGQQLSSSYGSSYGGEAYYKMLGEEPMHFDREGRVLPGKSTFSINDLISFTYFAARVEALQEKALREKSKGAGSSEEDKTPRGEGRIADLRRAYPTSCRDLDRYTAAYGLSEFLDALGTLILPMHADFFECLRPEDRVALYKLCENTRFKVPPALAERMEKLQKASPCADRAVFSLVQWEEERGAPRSSSPGLFSGGGGAGGGAAAVAAAAATGAVLASGSLRAKIVLAPGFLKETPPSIHYYMCYCDEGGEGRAARIADYYAAAEVSFNSEHYAEAAANWHRAVLLDLNGAYVRASVETRGALDPLSRAEGPALETIIGSKLIAFTERTALLLGCLGAAHFEEGQRRARDGEDGRGEIEKARDSLVYAVAMVSAQIAYIQKWLTAGGYSESEINEAARVEIKSLGERLVEYKKCVTEVEAKLASLASVGTALLVGAAALPAAATPTPVPAAGGAGGEDSSVAALSCRR